MSERDELEDLKNAEIHSYSRVVRAAVMAIPALILDNQPKTKLGEWRRLGVRDINLENLVENFFHDRTLCGFVSRLIQAGVNYGLADKTKKEKIKEELAASSLAWDGWYFSMAALKCVVFLTGGGERGVSRVCSKLRRSQRKDVETMMQRVGVDCSQQEIDDIWVLLSYLYEA